MVLPLVFKTDFFDDEYTSLLREHDDKFDELLQRFTKTCNELKEKRQKNVFIVDGPIGAGKTTVLEYLAKNVQRIVIVPEPVDVWTKIGFTSGEYIKSGLSEDGFVNLLKLFYNAKKVGETLKYFIYFFQLVVLISRVELMNKQLSIHSDDSEIIIFERHPLSDKYTFIL